MATSGKLLTSGGPGRLSAHVLFVVLLVSGTCVCRAADPDDEVIKWNNILLNTIRYDITREPPSSRNMAIVHVSAYDALSAIDRMYEPVQVPWVKVTDPTDRRAAVAGASHRALSGLYPQYKSTFDKALAESLAGIADPIARDNGLKLGQDVADSVLAWRSDDGWDAQSTYTVKGGIGQWRPTPPDYASPTTPQWGGVRPFVISSSDAFLPPPPPALTSSEYAAALNEVKEIGKIDSSTRTPDQTEIAVFWIDYPGVTATPAGKWNLVAQVLADQMQNDMADNARMFALMNLSMADGAIVAWKAKYEYDFWRPYNAIRQADQDGNPDTLVDPDWEPYLAIPPFPEYTSGHSTFGAAAAESMALFYGTDEIPFVIDDGFGVLPGVTRQYDTIWQAAEENGASRIYGGVHYEFANIEGLKVGRNIGEYVYKSSCRPIPAPGSLLLAAMGVLVLLRGRAYRVFSIASRSLE